MRGAFPRLLRVLAYASALAAGTGSALAAQVAEPDGTKSPAVALALSLVGTAAPLAVSLSGDDDALYLLAAAGLVLGPLPGYVYAGETSLGLKHAGIRAAALGATLGIVFLLESGTDEGSSSGLAVALALGGALTTAVLAAIDVARVDDRVRARNRALQPSFFRASRMPGLVLTWRH